MNKVISYKENTAPATTIIQSLLHTPAPMVGASMTTQSGTAVTGGIIFNGLALGNKDAVENEGSTMDECLSHTSPTGQLHYHSLTPCKNGGSKTVKPVLCQTDPSCLDNY